MRHSRQQIERELRKRIRDQVYPLGSRIPSRRQLQQELGGSPMTMQQAFDQLVAQGYLVPRGRLGTFVAERLPDASVIALVFNEAFEGTSWNRFWSGLHRVAAGWAMPKKAGGSGVSFRSYCIAGGRWEGPEYQRLCTDLADGALAGILFASPPAKGDGSPVFTARIPRVCISAGGTLPFATSLVQPQDKGVFEAIFRHFRTQGRSRVGGFAANPTYLERMRTLAAAHGLDARPEWWHSLPTDAFGAAGARRIVHLLGTLPPRQRPDCLLITDDNLVPPATAGIRDADWSIPQDLAVAAHANFPLVTHAAVPCLRYGPDAAEILSAGAAEIVRLATGADHRAIDIPFTIPGSTG